MAFSTSTAEPPEELTQPWLTGQVLEQVPKQLAALCLQPLFQFAVGQPGRLLALQQVQY